MIDTNGAFRIAQGLRRQSDPAFGARTSRLGPALLGSIVKLEIKEAFRDLKSWKGSVS